MSNYGSVPTTDADTGEVGMTSQGIHICQHKGVIAIVAVLLLFVAKSMAPETSIVAAPVPAPTPAAVVDVVEETPPPAFPLINKIGPGSVDQPTDTSNAPDFGFSKVADEPCNPKLGEPWRQDGGVRNSKHPVTFYFLPAVGDVPGLLSGIEVDYYDFEENPDMIGDYFSEEATSDDGAYRSLAVAFRDYNEHDLCDSSAPISHTGLEKVTIAPDMIELNLPINESDEELKSNWKEGSCIPMMGFHWSTDIVGGPEFTFEAKNLMPITPMYHSGTGLLNAVFFSATKVMQTWPEECEVDFVNFDQPCAAATVNSWDRAPGLMQANVPPLYMCNNFCGECQFTGAKDGMFTTMHFTFGYDNCGGVHCRNGISP